MKLSLLSVNIAANYLGVVITTLLSFLVVPFYLKWLGHDAYGLVGIAAMIQGWVMLLNSGLAPVAGRKAAEAYSGKGNWQEAVKFFRTIDWLIFILAMVVVICIFFSRDWLAINWISESQLPPHDVATSLVLLVAMTLLRLMTSVSRGVIANIEMQVWLNYNLILFSLLRFAMSLPIVYWTKNIEYLFIWWLLVSAFEYLSIQIKISMSLPVKAAFWVFDLLQLKENGRNAAMLAVTSCVWVVVTNLDKLLLSGYLSLSEFGLFSLAILLAGGIVTLSQPICQAFQPKLTRAYALGGKEAVGDSLMLCTRLVAILIYPIGSVIFCMPEMVLYAWTGDVSIAVDAASILQGYTIGNTFLAASGLLYMVQVALNDVRWHFRGNIIFAIILIPSLLLIVKNYGAEGASWLWAVYNLVLFVIWNSFLLKKLLHIKPMRWVVVEALLPLCLALCSSALLAGLVALADFSRMQVFIWLAFCGVSVSALVVIWTSFLQRSIVFLTRH
ncbi:lipopolysaccharide biosynthesis protein [Aeromonas veronii]